MSEKKPYCFYQLLPDGRFQFHVDGSLMKDFSLCERYFYLKHIKNLRRKGTTVVKPFSMAIGSWWSDAMDMFYSHIKDGGTELTKDGVQEIALQAWAKNDIDASAAAEPRQFKSFGDLAGAVLMLQEYYDNQYLIDRQNWKIVSVEQGFGLKNEVLIGENRHVVVYWVGKPDLTVVEQRRLEPVDHKTVSYIQGDTITNYKPGSQMIGYAYSTEVIAKALGIDTKVDRCIINICSRNRPSDSPRDGKRKPRFVRAYPNFNREEIEEWKKNVIARCERIAHCLQTGDWLWSDTTCHNMYRRNCDFKHPDSVSPSAREIVFATDFQYGEPWKPYHPSEEEE